MGQVRKINGVYYIEFYARSLLYSQMAGSDLAHAQKLLDEVEAKIARGEALTVARHIELPDFFERFLSEAKRQNTAKTVGRLASTIDHFRDFLQANFPCARQLAQLNPMILEAYKQHLVKSQSIKVANLTILLLRDVLDYGIKLGFINDNPSLHVSLLPWPKRSAYRPTARYQKAQQFLSKGLGLLKFSQLLRLPDVARLMYFSGLIPISLVMARSEGTRILDN